MNRSFVVGDRRRSLLADLYDALDAPIVLGLVDTVVFRMIAHDGSVKVNSQPATVVSRGDATLGTPAQVRYDWAPNDVNTAATYTAWFICLTGGLPEHFPTPDDRSSKLKIIFRAES